MQLDSSTVAHPVPIRIYRADKTFGTVLMVLAGVAIPYLVLGSLVSSVFTGISTVLHTAHLFRGHGHISGSGSEIWRHVFGTVVMSGLVFAGYGMLRSRRQSFLVGLVIGVAALVMNFAMLLAAATVIYAALRLSGSLGPKPD